MARRFFYDCEFMEEPWFLELISIGVVDEDGRGFYAVNLDADVSRANDWVKENVLSKIPPVWDGGPARGVPAYCMPELREKLLDFMRPSEEDPIELWGYYADYDHVLMCWIFGRMIDLPKGMPWYTLDIKQEMVRMGVKRSEMPPDPDGEHNALIDARWNRQAWKRLQAIKVQRRF